MEEFKVFEEKNYDEKKKQRYEDLRLIISDMSHVQLYNYIMTIAKDMRPDEIETLILYTKYHE